MHALNCSTHANCQPLTAQLSRDELCLLTQFSRVAKPHITRKGVFSRFYVVDAFISSRRATIRAH